MSDFLLAAFLMGVGLALAGAGTHLYQWRTGRTAALRYDGATLLHSFANILISFVCGPYIMLQLGWNHEQGDTLSVSSALLSSLVAFGWAFITGLLAVGIWVGLLA